MTYPRHAGPLLSAQAAVIGASRYQRSTKFQLSTTGLWFQLATQGTRASHGFGDPMRISGLCGDTEPFMLNIHNDYFSVTCTHGDEVQDFIVLGRIDVITGELLALEACDHRRLVGLKLPTPPAPRTRDRTTP